MKISHHSILQHFKTFIIKVKGKKNPKQTKNSFLFKLKRFSGPFIFPESLTMC